MWGFEYVFVVHLERVLSLDNIEFRNVLINCSKLISVFGYSVSLLGIDGNLFIFTDFVDVRWMNEGVQRFQKVAKSKDEQWRKEHTEHTCGTCENDLN